MRSRHTLGLLVAIVAGCSTGDPKLVGGSGAGGTPTPGDRDADAPGESGGDAFDPSEAEPPGAPEADLPDGAAVDAIDATDASEGSALDPGAYSGTWVGTTSQDRAIRFLADAPGIGEFEYGWVLGPCASTTRVTPGAPVPIVDGRAHGTLGGAPSVTFTIVFETASTASGTLDFAKRPDPYVPGCATQASATFVATKQ